MLRLTSTPWLHAPVSAQHSPTTTSDGAVPIATSRPAPANAAASTHVRAPNRSTARPTIRAVRKPATPNPVSSTPRWLAPSPNESSSRNATRNPSPPRQPQPMNATSAALSVVGTNALRRLGRFSAASVFGTPSTASIVATAAAPTNAQRHDASAASPPTSGAEVWPIACIDANSPSVRPRRSLGVIAASAPRSTGVTKAFAAPWTALSPIRTGKAHETAHRTEAAA